MKKTRSAKRALLMSALSLLLCVSMLVGTTFAWFTDSVTSAGNIIQSGTLDVDLVDAAGNSMAGKVIEFVTADDRAQDKILWEPGCTYETKPVKVINKGNLALKYQIVISGITGDAKLLEAIDWTVTVGTNTVALADLKGELLAGATTEAIVLKGHMKEEAGNEYQNLSVENIAISVYATQLNYENDSFGPDYDKITVVTNADELRAAVATGGNILLKNDVAFDADETITVSAGKEVAIDLNGNTITTVSDKTGSNRNAFDVRGTLSVVNGTITTKHIGTNMGWGNSTNVFNVTAGGVLNIENAIVKNLGGSDMAFVAHLNNWGEVTLNVNNSVLISSYTAVRVFNSGNDMNNVNITNSTLMGASQSFWVHNATLEDFGNDANKVATQAGLLNFNFIIDNPVDGVAADDTSNLVAEANNTFVGKIRYGFTNGAVYFQSAENVAANNAASLSDALAAGKNVVLTSNLNFNGNETSADSGYRGATGVSVKGGTLDGNGNSLGINNWGTWDVAVHTTGGTIKNLTINSGMRGIFMCGATEDVYIDNVVIDGTIYTFNSDDGNKNYGVYISNSTLNGWTSHSDVHKEVVYTNCDFGEGNGYAFCRPYGPTSFVGCDFEADFELDAIGKVTFKNCTIGGVALTAENLSTLVTSNIANASIG